MNMGPSQLNQMLASSGLISVTTKAKSPEQVNSVSHISDFVWQSAEMIMARDGHHQPMALYFSPRQMTIIDFGKLFSSDTGKETAAMAMRSFCDELKPDFFAIVMHAHMAKIRARSREEAEAMERELMKRKTLSDHPDTEETLIVTVETNRTSNTEISIVERRNGGKFHSLIRMEELEGAEMMSRMFIGVLNKTTTLH